MMVYHSVSTNKKNLPSIGRNLWHKGVFESRGETGATSASKTRLLDFIYNPVLAHFNYVLRLVPVASLHSGVDPRGLILVQVGENAVLVLQSAVGSESYGQRSQRRASRQNSSVKRFAKQTSILHH